MFFQKKYIPIPNEPSPSPYTHASLFSKITYSWENPIFQVGYNRPLEKNDLYMLDPTFTEEYNEERYYKCWEEVKIKNNGKGSVLKTLIKVFGPKWIPADDNKYEPYKGWMYVFIIFVLQMIATLCSNYYSKLVMEVGLSVRATLIGIIYHKTLKLSNKSRQSIGDGHIVNLISTDSSRIQHLLSNLHYIWSTPLQFFISVGLLVRSMGIYCLISLGICVIVFPIQGFIIRLLTKKRKKTAILTDQRVKKTQEIIGNIRIIKFFGWEKSFLQILQFLREKELKFTKRIIIIDSETNAFLNISLFLASALTFIAYSAAGYPLTAAKVFSCHAIFNMIRFPLAFFANTCSQLTSAYVAMKRLINLLNAKELDDLPEIDVNSPFAVIIDNGQFNWESVKPLNYEDYGTSCIESVDRSMTDEDEEYDVNSNTEQIIEKTVSMEPSGKGQEVKILESFKLKDVYLHIKKNSLTAIVGTVGSGKSSLINAIIGEMKREAGKITIGGSFSYCSQQAWIQNATVRENILFGREYDKEFYDQVIECCALTHDLEHFSNGDMTEIGERGINLSGGQKQRINLARAVYFNSDIIIMDDPLSAVDPHVSRFLFDKCITGALSNKTRILVTHQLHILPKVDYVIVMNNGRIEEQGEFKQLMQKNGELARLMRTYGEVNDEEEKNSDYSKSYSNELGKITNEKEENSSYQEDKSIIEEEKKNENECGLICQEERVTGSVKLDVYKEYMYSSGGYLCGIIILLLVVIIQLTKIANDVWLVYWTEDHYNMSTNTYIMIYLSWNVAYSLMIFIYFAFMAHAGIRASKKIHEKAICRVLMAPLYFFDANPFGRIINRFSKDQDSLDNILFLTIQNFLSNCAGTISTLILMLYASPILSFALIPLFLIYYFVQQLYRNASREMKRLESILRSPVYVNFTETIQGLPTIRAYHKQDHLIRLNQHFIDENNRPLFLQLNAQRWLGLRLESIGAFLVLFDGIAGMLLRNTTSASLLGLSLSYALQVTSSLNNTVRYFTNTEVQMNSAERLLHYANKIDIENQEGTEAPKDWPQHGKIEIRDLTMRYAPHLPPILHHISLDIESNQKIGVVGRTGAGKSSITMALFRMVEHEECSSVKIDGIPIKYLKLRDLRQKISIIPQEPILFSGTIRFNMDPFDEHTDQEIWDALENAGIKQTIMDLEGKLESEVCTNGENFSVGQRQLLCLARAMIRNSHILIMDEATASVDIETDTIIQRALRTKFNNSTVITIAHRLNTIIDYDKILVLSQGEVLEYDTPLNLLFKAGPNDEFIPNNDTEFSRMVDETGFANAELLRQLVLENCIIKI
ncbi:hypothetical protein PIROE2DRAFT_43511 [Piromyces sp. E2]|nr:hypothetical protein PIROE2DRAFT_43511 [Piromyces sp. E2]|eukprot:OUM63265.1 hypothetical protein PIROE2DRAFT_43511 [Piromyces sp. E2]